MQNPLKAIRESKGLSVTDLSILTNVSTMTINRIEKGVLNNVSPDVLKTLEKWGYDRKKVERDYQSWKDYRIRELEEKIM